MAWHEVLPDRWFLEKTTLEPAACCTPCWTLLRNKFIGRQHQISHGPFLSRSFLCKKLSPVKTVATLLPMNNSKKCCMLPVAFVCTPVCMLLGVIAQSLKPVSFPLSTAAPKIVTQQLPTLLARQYWELLSPFVRSLMRFSQTCVFRCRQSQLRSQATNL